MKQFATFLKKEFAHVLRDRKTLLNHTECDRRYLDNGARRVADHRGAGNPQIDGDVKPERRGVDEQRLTGRGERDRPRP